MKSPLFFALMMALVLGFGISAHAADDTVTGPDGTVYRTYPTGPTLTYNGIAQYQPTGRSYNGYYSGGDRNVSGIGGLPMSGSIWSRAVQYQQPSVNALGFYGRAYK